MQPDAKGSRRSGSGPFPTAGYADWIDRCWPEEGVQYAVSAVDRLPHSSTFFLRRTHAGWRHDPAKTAG